MRLLSLFILLSAISLCFSTEEKPEKKTLSITNRFIDFTGEVKGNCDTRNSNYIYNLFFYAQITGFTRDESFILYVKTPRFAYMKCTIVYSTDVNSYVSCSYDVDKFFMFGTINLNNDFPSIPDCQVSNWNSVTKSFYVGWLQCMPVYDQQYMISSITDPLCESSTRNIIQMTGGIKVLMSSHSTTLSYYKFSLPAIVDGKEKDLNCTMSYRYDYKDYALSCTFEGYSTLSFFDTIIYYPDSKADILFRNTNEYKLMNCGNPERTIKFLNVNNQCNKNLNILKLYFSSFIFGFYQESHFRMYLQDPSYAYLECDMPKSIITSSENVIECTLDIEKFPLYINRKITLPSDFAVEDCHIQYWSRIDKEINTGVCYPTLLGEITPSEVKEAECSKDDFNVFGIKATYDFSGHYFYYSFYLNALIGGKYGFIPCEFFTWKFDNSNHMMYCYSNQTTNITLFPTIITIENRKVAISFNPGTIVNLNQCSVTEKRIYFNAVRSYCERKTREYYIESLFYAKFNKFANEYSFKFPMVVPPNSYSECTMSESSEGIEKITYIKCKLDILKFPINGKYTFSSEFPFDDAEIINNEIIWKSFIIGKGCSLGTYLNFTIENYIKAECYKPHYNKISAIGKITQQNNTDIVPLKNSYSFDMNVIINGEYVLIPCQLKGINDDLIEYKLDCVTNSTNDVTIYNTIIVDDKTDLFINISGSHQYLMETCNPSKYITFKSLTSECSSDENIFKIFLYADIKGFSQEENIQIYLEEPSYIYMNCKIPKPTEEESYIYCYIDVKKFPLISHETITLPKEFYAQSELEIINWDNINRNIPTQKCSVSYNYLFDAVKYMNPECYLNGNYSFIAEGVFKDNNNNIINNFNIHKISLNAYIDSQIKRIQCDILSPDVSNKYSRIFCNAKIVKKFEILPIIALDETTQEKIFVNMGHVYDNIATCSSHDKMLFFKGVKSECSERLSYLKLFLYTDVKGFNEETKFNISLLNPNISYGECLIPKTNYKGYIECNFNITLFHLSSTTIQLNITSINILNCFLSNILSINKALTTGKCVANHSTVFTIINSDALYVKCLDKNYNVIAFIGSFPNGEKKKTTIILNVFINENLETLKCDIYPPDESYQFHRMYCYTNKIGKVRIFYTIANDIINKENLEIGTYDANIDLLNCKDVNKTIFFKGINVYKKDDHKLNISFFGNINGDVQKQTFLIYLKTPGYFYLSCLMPETKKTSNDIYINCILDVQIFPLRYFNYIELPKTFPAIQGYSASNWNLNQYSTLYTDYYYQDYKLYFNVIGSTQVDCYMKGINMISFYGSLETEEGLAKLEQYEFENYVKQDNYYAYISCILYNINSYYGYYQMECFSIGQLKVLLFPTIFQDKNSNEFIFIDKLEEVTLKKCNYEVTKTVSFDGSKIPDSYCSDNSFNGGVGTVINFYAHTTGFSEEETFRMDIISPSRYYLVCHIFATKINVRVQNIYCVLDGKKYPLINIDKIQLPEYSPSQGNIVFDNWEAVPKYIDVSPCYENYDLTLSLKNSYKNRYQNCKNKEEGILTVIITLSYKNGGIINTHNNYKFNLTSTDGETTCELYPYNGGDEGNYIMECLYKSRKAPNYLPTIVKDELSGKNIFISFDIRAQYGYCDQYSKFINFQGNVGLRCSYDNSMLEISFDSEIIGVSEKETFQLNLENPSNIYLDCSIPYSGNSVKCILDLNKFILNEDDFIKLPSELKINGYSITYWTKVANELHDVNCNTKVSNIFYVSSDQSSSVDCDYNNGNNIITIKGRLYDTSKISNYNFKIMAEVDKEFPYIQCSFAIKDGDTSMVCKARGHSYAKIYETQRAVTDTNEIVVVNMDSRQDFSLYYCSDVGSPASLKLFEIIQLCLLLLLILF